MNVSLFLLWLVLGVCVCQEAAVGAPRGIALNRRGGLPRALGSKATSTTSTPPPPPQEEAEDSEYEDVADEEGDSESGAGVGVTEAPTTQANKLKVRPFRSNDDLLATLKRRRAEAATNKHNHHDQQQSSAGTESQQQVVEPAKGIQGRRKFNLGSPAAAPAVTAPQEETTASAKTARSRFNNGRVAFKTNPTPNEGNAEASSAEVKPRPGYRSRKF